MKINTLVITSQSDIPLDVLVEHVGYHLRTDFKEQGFFNVEASGPRGYTQRYFAREEPA